jgi:arylamine N-acetyltransferase
MQANVRRFFDRYDLSCKSPDLDFLSQLAKAYSNLPYENVTKILKSRSGSVSEEKFRRTEEVLTDHMNWNTGGTCFSLCNALEEILTSCGFSAFIAMADMHYGENIHCAVIVTIAGSRYLLDPGYLLHDPIPLPNVQISHQTLMNTIVLKNERKENYSLFTEENGIQRWRYRLRARPVTRFDFEKHWLHSFSLNSMEAVMLTRMNDSGRLYYRKDRLELVGPARRTSQKITVADSGMLSTMFGVPSDLILQARKAIRS